MRRGGTARGAAKRPRETGASFARRLVNAQQQRVGERLRERLDFVDDALHDGLRSRIRRERDRAAVFARMFVGDDARDGDFVLRQRLVNAHERSRLVQNRNAQVEFGTDFVHRRHARGFPEAVAGVDVARREEFVRIVADADHRVDDVADYGGRSRVLPRAAPDENRRSRDVAGELYRVVDAVDAGERLVQRDQRGINAERKRARLEIAANHADELDAVAEIARAVHVFERDVADALDEGVALGNPFSVGEERENDGFVESVPSVEVEPVVRLDVAERLGVSEDFLVRFSFRLHAGKNVVACAVDDAGDRFEAVRDESFPQRLDDGNAAGDGRFEVVMPAEALHRVENLPPEFVDQRLVRRNDDFAELERGERVVLRLRRAAHQLADDVHGGIDDDLHRIVRQDFRGNADAARTYVEKFFAVVRIGPPPFRKSCPAGSPQAASARRARRSISRRTPSSDARRFPARKCAA